MPLILPPKRQRQGESEASLTYIASFRIARTT